MAQSELARGKEGSATLARSIARAAEFLSEFDAHLGTVKGLSEGTRRKYGRFVRGFLDDWCRPVSRKLHDSADLSSLCCAKSPG